MSPNPQFPVDVVVFTEEILKDTHKEKSPLNKIPAFTKSVNMDIWVVDSSKQLFYEERFLNRNKIFKKIK